MSRKFSKTKSIIIGLITGVVLAGGVYYYLANNQTTINNVSPYPQSSSTNQISTTTPSTETNQHSSNTNQLNSEKFFLTAIKYSVSHLDKLSPTKAPTSQKWQAQFFWFSSNSSDFYIEYSTPDHSVWRKILVRVKVTNGTIDYQTIGYFEGGENGYYLISGQDTLKSQSKLILYYFSSKTNSWEKK
ncbi:MAG TPA: hypothetical protein ENL06_01755 [Candidatus Portnoybacteria bacterium]|nr:hypothetical protein [Candidatus Portnoybacteria bacterium]